ncbi:MAG: hypothetical protein JW976_08805 [Syntrophaceae bacterium]|nr:hypothetical protein [Syntrophaceae bacterium]
MSILEITRKKNKNVIIKPTKGVLGLTVLAPKQGVKPKRFKKLIKKLFNR